MQFKNKIGEFYIDTCCLLAGYNNLGELVEKEESPVEIQNSDNLLPELTPPEEKPKRRYQPSGKYSVKKIESNEP